MRKQYLIGSTNFETFLGDNDPTDTNKVGQNLRTVFGDSDALVNSQTSTVIQKGDSLEGTGGGQAKAKVVAPIVSVNKRMKYVIQGTPQLAEIDEEDGSSSSVEEESEDLVGKIT